MVKVVSKWRNALVQLPGNRWRLHIPMLKCNGRIAVVPIEQSLAAPMA
jgi:hypothetical protein